MTISVGVVAKWDAALHGKVWAHTHSFRRSGCGKRSHDKFDTTLITTETTPIVTGAAKAQRCNLPYLAAVTLLEMA